MITIGIPFYNDEQFLEFAIKSVFNQTYTDWKLILISDGGTDNSLSIARKYENDERVTIIADGENRQLPYRLNQIAKLSTTKYLARMDADDIMHPDRIKKQLEILKANPEIDVLGSNAYSIDENNKIKGIKTSISSKSPDTTSVKSFIHPTIIAKTSWFLENPYDVNAIRCEDAELWRRTRNNNIFRVTNEPLLYYREFGNSYYKKYFKSLQGVLFIAKQEFKSNRKIEYFFKGYLRALLTGFIYFLFNLVNKENLLIRRRYTQPESVREIDFL